MDQNGKGQGQQTDQNKERVQPANGFKSGEGAASKRLGIKTRYGQQMDQNRERVLPANRLELEGGAASTRFQVGEGKASKRLGIKRGYHQQMDQNGERVLPANRSEPPLLAVPSSRSDPFAGRTPPDFKPFAGRILSRL